MQIPRCVENRGKDVSFEIGNCAKDLSKLIEKKKKKGKKEGINEVDRRANRLRSFDPSISDIAICRV